MRIRSLLPFYLVLGLAYSVFASSGFFIENGSGPAKGTDQKIYSKNPKANALYIQGLDYLSKGKPWAGGSVENAKKAVKLFREAARKDPQFALAYVGEADALDAATFSVPGSLEPAKAYREQETAALKAVELDDSLPQAHDQLASIYYENAYDWPKAEREMKRVIELTPSAAAGHNYYGLFLGTMGRFEEAETQVKLAQTLDEKSSAPNQVMMQILYWEHKDDAAIAEGLQALQKNKSLPTHFFLAFPYIHEGQFAKGIEELKLASQGGDAGSLAALAYAYAMAGDKVDLKGTLARFQHHPAHDHVAYRLAAVYVALGDKDRAISLIEKDYRQRSSWLDRLKVDPVMDPLRQESRFKELMHKMNFEQ